MPGEEIRQVELPDTDKDTIKKVSREKVLPVMICDAGTGPPGIYLQKTAEAAVWVEGSLWLCSQPCLLPLPAQGEYQHLVIWIALSHKYKLGLSCAKL